MTVHRRTYLWHTNEHVIIGLGYNQPTLKHFFPFKDYASISATAFTRNSDTHNLHYKGTHKKLFSAKTEGYKRNGKSVLFGEAAYIKGKSRNIKWSHADDHHRLGPYLIADTTTGNPKYETYLLSGGLSRETRLGMWGMSADYRAKNRYRTSDPRSYSVISDFSLLVNWSVPLRSNLIPNISVSYGHYEQDVSIRNVQSDRTDRFYFLYGYGFYNQQISGTNKNYSLNYKGDNIKLTGQLLPLKDTGPYVSVQFIQEAIDALHHNRIRGNYLTNKLQSFAGYQKKKNKTQYRIGMEANLYRGVGTEYYYEQVVVDTSTMLSESRLLTKNQKYIQNKTLLALSIKGWFRLGHFRINPSLKAGIHTADSKYKTTPFKTARNQGLVSTGLELIKIREHSLTGMTIKSTYLNTRNMEQILPKENHIVQNTLSPDDNYLTASKSAISIATQHIHTMENEIAWRVQVGYHLIKYQNKRQSTLHVSLSLIL
jgi:hypothetical protein